MMTEHPVPVIGKGRLRGTAWGEKFRVVNLVTPPVTVSIL